MNPLSKALFLALVATCSLVYAKPQLPRIFTDHMVIQQQKPIKVWGWADKGEKLTVSFAGQEARATAGDDGTWSVTLKAMKANATPQTLTVNGKGTVTLKGVLIGEVWFFGRQASIDISLGKRLPQAAQDTPLVRFFPIETCARPKPQEDLPFEGDLSGGRILTYPADITVKKRAVNAHGPWCTADSTNCVRMSAAAFVFARDLSSKLGVPVGVIDVPMGPSVLESWMSPEAVIAAEGHKYSYLVKPEAIAAWNAEEEQQKYEKAMSKYKERLRAASSGKIGEKPRQPVYPGYLLLSTSGCFNAAIWPIRHLGMRGVLLYQGACYTHAPFTHALRNTTHLDFKEAVNAYYSSYNYKKFQRYGRQEKSIPHLIPDWRKAFGDETLSFGLIEAMGSGPEAADMDVHYQGSSGGYLSWYREIMARVCAETPDAALIPAHDLRQPGNRQPSDETRLGERCLNWALGRVYKRGELKTGPVFDAIKHEGKHVIVTFKPATAGGLTTVDGKPVHGFWIGKKAFTDKGQETSEYLPAEAGIMGNTIVISKSTMPDATDVRYDWTTLADGNVANATGLPLMPFRTDRFERRGIGVVKKSELDKPMNEWAEPSQLLYGRKGSSITLGSTGLFGYNIGPNIVINGIEPGSPADGVVLLDDALVGANGVTLGKNPHIALGKEIDKSQRPENKGKLLLKLVRNGDVLDVELTIKTLPAYSDTSPYDCPRAAKILADAREYAVDQLGAKTPVGMLGCHVGLSLLSSGEPRYQNLVRRIAHAMIKRSAKYKDCRGKIWGVVYEGLFLSEYYLATGDKAALPALKNVHDFYLYVSPGHMGVWSHMPMRGKNRGGYGTLNGLGTTIMIALLNLKEAGIKIDQAAFNKARAYFKKYTKYGRIIYGTGVPRPDGLKPSDIGKGLRRASNGASATSALFWHRQEPNGDCWRECAEEVADSYQNRTGGHGGHFYSVFWGPMGAGLAGKAKLAKFMKEQRWTYALYRRFDGGLTDHSGCGRYTSYGTEMATTAYTLAYALPEKALRITGKEKGLFGQKYTGDMAAAVGLYRDKKYEECLTFMKEKGLDHPELTEQVARVRKSIALTREAIDRDLKIGDPVMARARLEGLEAVVAGEPPWLLAYKKTLADPALKPLLAAGDRFYKYRGKSQTRQRMVIEKVRISERDRASMEHLATTPTAGIYSKWAADYLKANPPVFKKDDTEWTPIISSATHLWFLTFAEQNKYLPKDWLSEDFDQKGWYTTTFSNVWPIDQWAVLRTSFFCKHARSFKKLKLRMHFEFCENTGVYLNGKKIVRCEAGISGTVPLILSDKALACLRKGRNQLVIISRNTGRWNGISNHPFNVMLDGEKR